MNASSLESQPRQPMNTYEIWCNLKDSKQDLEFCAAVHAWMEHLRNAHAIESWRLSRRKLGLGPAEFGEFHLSIEVRDLAQLDLAFQQAAPRSGTSQNLHAAVYERVTDFKAALYRDFPDELRPLRTEAASK